MIMMSKVNSVDGAKRVMGELHRMATAASRGHAANHVPQECGYDRVPAGLSWLTRFAAFGVISVSKVRRHWALSGTIAHKMTMLQVFSRSHNLRICHFGTLTN